MTIAAEVDIRLYGRLLAKTVPAVIKTEEENNRMLAIVEKLMAKGEDHITPEEDALLELLVDLIHDFEDKHYPLPKSEPHRMVAFLLEHRSLKPRDLWPVLGSKSRVSGLLSGKRGVSKEQAKRLAAYFQVPIDLLI